MELLLPFIGETSVPLWLLLVIALLTLLYLYGSYPFNAWTNLGVPGPKPTIFVGNIPELFGPESSKAAFAKWHSLYGRVYGIYYFRIPTLVITEPELIKQVMVKDFNKFRNRLSYSNNALLNREAESGVFFAEGEDWKRIRRIVTPCFSIAKIKSMTPVVNRSAIRLGEHVLNSAKNGVPVDAKLLYGALSLDVVTGTGFSIDVDSVSNLDEPFTRHGRSLFIYKKYIKPITLLVSAFPKIAYPITKALNVGFFKNEDMTFFEENIIRMVKDREQEAKEGSNRKRIDFLQFMTNAMNGTSDTTESAGKLSLAEVVGQGIIIFIAGYETASSTLQFLSYELGKHPAVLNKIIEEIDNIVGKEEPTYDTCQNLKYMEAAINETLRMYPPLSVITRQVTEPTTLNGINLAPGTGIAIPLYNIGRDPEFWENPNDFWPERFLEEKSSSLPDPITYIPFGTGPRICVGMNLGMLEMKLALIQVLRRVTITKATPENLHINDFTSILQPSERIMIHVTPR